MTPPPRVSRLVLLGQPVAHSLSPRFQQAALDACELPLRYEAQDVSADALGAVVSALVAERAAGNVTVPHKEAMFALCARRTSLAERVGAVNCFWVDADGALIGDNTDVAGFRVALRAVLSKTSPSDLVGRDTDLSSLPELSGGLRVALLGAGGAAASVCAALEGLPMVEVRVLARTAARAEALAIRFPAVRVVRDVPALLSAEGAEPLLVVNATPQGLAGEALPLEPSAIAAAGGMALDLAYRSGGTPWVRACRAEGLVAQDGLGMLVEQGAVAFERWFDRPAPRAVMWEALKGL